MIEQSYPKEKASKNRELGWLFFVREAAGREAQGLRRSANTLSTDTLTGIVHKPATTQILVGAELARESGGSGDIDVG